MNTPSLGIHDDSSTFPSFPLTQASERRGAAARLLDLLIRSAVSHRFLPAAYIEAEAAVAALPLMTAEFGLASTRLKNALLYDVGHEHAAASIELRQLRRQLKQAA